MKILAGIVLYNPDEYRLEKNIGAISSQVDKVVLIDNFSENISKIISKYKNDSKIEIIRNDNNYGIARALNQIFHYAYENQYNWFLTLDQDSVVKHDLIEKYKEYINVDTNVALITSEYEDLNVKVKKEKFEDKDYKYIDYCITSGSFYNTNKLIGKCEFDEKMFIDLVDYDFCASIRENNLKIIKINYIGFFHEVGKSQTIRIMWKEEIIFNHSSLRVFYIVRNSLYFIKKHKKSINVIKWYLKTLKKVLLILLFEKEKKEKFNSIKNGIKAFNKMSES